MRYPVDDVRQDRTATFSNVHSFRFQLVAIVHDGLNRGLPNPRETRLKGSVKLMPKDIWLDLGSPERP
jgi:hypothetical protein